MLPSDELKRSSPSTPAPKCPVSCETGGDTATIQNRSEAQPAIIDPLDEYEIADKFYTAALDVEDAVNLRAATARTSLRNDESEFRERAFGEPFPANKVKYGKEQRKEAGLQFDAAGRYFNYVKIPGFGSPHVNCGNFFSVKICTHCGKLTPRVNTCDRPSCPICWQSWARKEAERVEERFTGFRTAYKKTKGRRLGNPMHLVFSPPPVYAIEKARTKEGRSALKQVAIRLAKRAGIYGGVAFLHPYRVKDAVKPALVDASTREAKKFWELIREDALGLGSWREYVILSPHIHVIGHGSPPQYANLYAKTGWIIKFVRHVSGEDEVAALAYYELSHVGVDEGRRTVNWFGSMSYNQLKKGNRHVEFEEEKCEACGGDMIIYYPDTGRSHPAILKTVWWEYIMKKRKK